MAFNTIETSGLEIYYVSPKDPGIDWPETEKEAGFTKEDYKSDPSEDKAKKLIAKTAEELTIFYLSIPSSKAINDAFHKHEDLGAIQHLARTHILRAENLYRGNKPVVIKRRKGQLTEQDENLIPSPVFHEIGYYLVNQGGGIDGPLEI